MEMVKFFKVLELPAELEPNSFYLVKFEEKFDLYVTNDNAIPTAYPLNMPEPVTPDSSWAYGEILRDEAGSITGIIFESTYQINIIRDENGSISRIEYPDGSKYVFQRLDGRITGWTVEEV